MSNRYSLHLLEIKDFKRIRFAQIPFAPGLTILGGQNAQGKTSAIDALVSVLGGVRLSPGKPVRQGSDKAELKLVIEGPSGKLYARRYFTEDGGTALEVKNEEGFKSGSPQKLFDSFLGNLALDPLAFTRVKPREQVEIFKGAFGIDTTAIDEKRRHAYEERTLQNRTVRDLEGRFRDMPEAPEGTPEEEVNVGDLTVEIDRIATHNTEVRRAQDDVALALDRVETTQSAIASNDERIADLRRQIEELEARGKVAKNNLTKAEEELAAAHAKAEATQPVDAEPVRERLRQADETNRWVRSKREREKARIAWQEATQRVEDLTALIEAADREKAEALKTVELPVEGLSFDDSGLYLNGIPFDQASSAEQLRVSVPLAFAQNSALKFAIIRDGSLLDDESMALVAQLVDEAGGQLIVERVGDSDEDAIVFEDGVVKGVQPELAGAGA